MENHTISLSIRVFELIKKSSELTGRSFEDELSHGIMMYFDPQYALQEMERTIQGLREQTEESIGEEDNVPELTLANAEIMYVALTRSKRLTERMRKFLTVLSENDDYLTNSAYARATGLQAPQISYLLAWLTRYLKRVSNQPYTWKDYMEMDAKGRYRMPVHMRDVVREYLETHS